MGGGDITFGSAFCGSHFGLGSAFCDSSLEGGELPTPFQNSKGACKLKKVGTAWFTQWKDFRALLGERPEETLQKKELSGEMKRSLAMPRRLNYCPGGEL